MRRKWTGRRSGKVGQGQAGAAVTVNTGQCVGIIQGRQWGGRLETFEGSVA